MIYLAVDSPMKGKREGKNQTEEKIEERNETNQFCNS